MPHVGQVYCFVTSKSVVLFCSLSSTLALAVLPSTATVILKTEITLPSRLSVSSNVSLPFIFTETLVMPGSPFIGASAPSSLAVYDWPVGLVMVMSSPLTLYVQDMAFDPAGPFATRVASPLPVTGGPPFVLLLSLNVNITVLPSDETVEVEVEVETTLPFFLSVSSIAWS